MGSRVGESHSSPMRNAYGMGAAAAGLQCHFCMQTLGKLVEICAWSVVLGRKVPPRPQTPIGVPSSFSHNLHTIIVGTGLISHNISGGLWDDCGKRPSRMRLLCDDCGGLWLYGSGGYGRWPRGGKMGNEGESALHTSQSPPFSQTTTTYYLLVVVVE